MLATKAQVYLYLVVLLSLRHAPSATMDTLLRRARRIAVLALLDTEQTYPFRKARAATAKIMLVFLVRIPCYTNEGHLISFIR